MDGPGRTRSWNTLNGKWGGRASAGPRVTGTGVGVVLGGWRGSGSIGDPHGGGGPKDGDGARRLIEWAGCQKTTESGRAAGHPRRTQGKQPGVEGGGCREPRADAPAVRGARPRRRKPDALAVCVPFASRGERRCKRPLGTADGALAWASPLSDVPMTRSVYSVQRFKGGTQADGIWAHPVELFEDVGGSVSTSTRPLLAVSLLSSMRVQATDLR